LSCSNFKGSLISLPLWEFRFATLHYIPKGDKTCCTYYLNLQMEKITNYIFSITFIGFNSRPKL
jgi:hypothetical protein